MTRLDRLDEPGSAGIAREALADMKRSPGDAIDFANEPTRSLPPGVCVTIPEAYYWALENMTTAMCVLVDEGLDHFLKHVDDILCAKKVLSRYCPEGNTYVPPRPYVRHSSRKKKTK